MVKNIKEVHPNSIVLYEIGAFYYAYNRDAYIISYLFNYKLKKVNDDIYSSAFPKKYIARIKSKIETNKIDYILLDVRNNYEVIEKSENRNLNKYYKIFNKAQQFVKNKRRIDIVVDKLLLKIEQNDFLEKIRKIESIINES